MSDGHKTKEQKASAYDRYINWKLFAIPLVLFFGMIFLPTPPSMLEVGVEYSFGDKYMEEYFAKEIFQKPSVELSQWQIQMVRMMTASVNQTTFGLKTFLGRNERWVKGEGIPTTKTHLAQVQAEAKKLGPQKFEAVMKTGYKLKNQDLTYAKLKPEEKKQADKAGFHVRVAVGLILFVVCCFVTEAIPLPMVAFCSGVIALMTGIFNRSQVPMLYWSDATWFIMGSLMFGVAFVKTGLDRRLAMAMFGWLKTPSTRWVSLVFIGLLSVLTMFMSDHALAAMFMPIGIVLYRTACEAKGEEDPELIKFLMLVICMGVNLGGSLSPSGAARNIIMINYAEQMFGLNIGFAQWCMYCVPMLIFFVPATWLVMNWVFKPKITDLSVSINVVRQEIARTGGRWTRPQIISLVIFVIMLFCWVTEKNLILEWTGIRFGIGILAVMGGIAYILAGVTNWRDYQSRVDWGVVWLYAGAIIFGEVLVKTGGAYWVAKELVALGKPLGLDHGLGLMVSGGVITAFITQFMADGPACAAVGPITLSMAGIVHAGTSMIPFMSMATAIASSFAYCLVIGTPPNAIVYSSGYLEAKDFLRAGAILAVVNFASMVLVMATYWTWLGWPGLKPF